ncbi:aminoacyl-tRNA hydrolase [Croceivirga lutea]|uniref:alternative ribosome rescue aminoacyl-tRNA hydrolase ArfB n=1 Tax=Croceivirga lutea TaxID=1775167 RepID=UPI00163ADDC2|nr:alternative ribosome rescue aminoacyl-tRNA hydrolase ArfB [Croceivirga lutea]GGG38434.1 aminoacyl-tRNA hydrolase [Croceivirga lutea]
MDIETIIKELQFKAVRSSGPGGQHANKVSSKIQLTFDLNASNGLSEKEKGILLRKLENFLTKEGVLTLQAQDYRSQHKNKDLVIKRFVILLKKALKQPKKRKTTKPSKSAIEKRLKSKKLISDKKQSRQKPKI